MGKNETRKDTVATPVDPNRAEIEARRGIVRDDEGRIVRTKAWKKDRIEHLKDKIEDYAVRTKNAKTELKALEAEVK
jgi:hypothetical protein